MKLVECEKMYWEFVRSLRNDPKVSDGFIKKHYITTDEQIKYMTINSSSYRIALVDNCPAGYVGVIDGDIRVCTHPDFQGLGIRKFMIKQCMRIWPNSYAKIKINNVASINLFKSCGFDIIYFVMEKSDTSDDLIE